MRNTQRHDNSQALGAGALAGGWEGAALVRRRVARRWQDLGGLRPSAGSAVGADILIGAPCPRAAEGAGLGGGTLLSVPQGQDKGHCHLCPRGRCHVADSVARGMGTPGRTLPGISS